MGFIPVSPLEVNTLDVNTSGSIVDQMWQELVSLRYQSVRSAHLTKPGDTAPWVDQAKTYFLDASNSDWRSSGLLYYYSFLNLSKALLANKGMLSSDELGSMQLMHGLKDTPQSPESIMDYEIIIKGNNSNKNIFQLLYKCITGVEWPYCGQTTIKISSIANYCLDIGSELHSLFGLSCVIENTRSLLRSSSNGAEVWFELSVRSTAAEMIRSDCMHALEFENMGYQSLNHFDYTDWHSAYGQPAHTFQYLSVLRGPKYSINGNQTQAFRDASSQATDVLKVRSLPSPVPNRDNYFHYIPDASISGKQIQWHPLLSDYLVSFALGSLLRYHPEFLYGGTINTFFSESWCNQSPITALRYFLMLFTSPPVRLAAY